MTPALDDIPDFWPNRSASRFVEAGGLTWHVQIMGDGPDILLIHGTGGSTHSWYRLAPFLKGYRLIAMDLPGQGFTSPFSQSSNPQPYGIDAMAAGIAGLMTALGLKPRAVVGHSAGAAIAIRLGLDGHLSQACDIITLNAALKPYGGAVFFLFSPFAKLLASTKMLARVFAKQSANPGAVERFLEATGSDIADEDIRYYRTLLSDPDHVWYTLKMMADWNLGPLVKAAPFLQQPITLLAGREDGTVDYRVSKDIAKRIEGAHYHLFEDVGHIMHEESPEEIAGTILTQLSE